MPIKRKPSGRIADRRLPSPVDVHVGGRIRLRRTLVGLSQEAMAERLGVTFQQVLKYERGTNRVSSSRLFDLCRILNAPVAYFFDEMSREVTKQSPSQRAGKSPKRLDQESDPVSRRETLKLVRAYYGIKDRGVRQRFVNMIRAIATEG